MPSEFDTLAADFCSDGLSEQFGARDELGDVAAVVCDQPDGTKHTLLGVIVSRGRISDQIEDEHGTHLRDEIEDVLELHVPLQQEFGTFAPKTTSKWEVPGYSGERFTLLEVLALSPVWAHVRVTRKHVSGIRRSRSERS